MHLKKLFPFPVLPPPHIAPTHRRSVSFLPSPRLWYSSVGLWKREEIEARWFFYLRLAFGSTVEGRRRAGSESRRRQEENKHHPHIQEQREKLTSFQPVDWCIMGSPKLTKW